MAMAISYSGFLGLSKKDMGDPPVKIRFAAREIMISELSVNTWVISKRLAPDAKYVANSCNSRLPKKRSCCSASATCLKSH